MDYSKFLIKPFEPDTLAQLECYPEFQFEIRDKDKIVNFMILMYDPNSHAQMDYPGLYDRKREVAKIIGFKLKDGKFEDHIEAVLVGENHEYNLAMIRYTQMFGIPNFDVLVAYREMLARELSAAMVETDPKVRTAIQKNIDTDLQRIAELENKIFSGDETLSARESLYRLIEKKRVPRPEIMAELIESKDLTMLPDVHGKSQIRGEKG